MLCLVNLSVTKFWASCPEHTPRDSLAGKNRGHENSASLTTGKKHPISLDFTLIKINVTHSSRNWSYSAYILAALAKVLRLAWNLGQHTADSLWSQLEICRDPLCTVSAQSATCEGCWKSARSCRVCCGFYPGSPLPLLPPISLLPFFNSESLSLKQLTRSWLNLWNVQQLDHYSHCRYNAFIRSTVWTRQSKATAKASHIAATFGINQDCK